MNCQRLKQPVLKKISLELRSDGIEKYSFNLFISYHSTYNMNILHLSTSDGGGAGGAAMRIHNCLLNYAPEVNSKALVVWKKQNQVDELYSIRDSYKGLSKYQLQFIDYLTFLLEHKILHNKVNYWGILFQHYWSFYHPENHSLVQDWADVIHLHYVNRYIHFPTFFKKTKKPLVWSFHDMTPFTGGNSYEMGGIAKYRQQYDEFLDYKRNAIEKNEVFGIASSPTFYEKSITEYKTFEPNHCTVTDFPLETNVFKIYDAVKCRDHLELPRNVKIILFVCADIREERKGFKFLLKNFNILFDKDIHIAVVGNNTDDIPHHENIHSLGYIGAPTELAKIYSAVDVFVTPAIEEAFGLTTTESIACGTPVVAFNTAGALAQIVDGENGVLCEEMSSTALLNGINKAFSTTWSRQEIGTKAQERFNAVFKAKEYVDYYQYVVNQ